MIVPREETSLVLEEIKKMEQSAVPIERLESINEGNLGLPFILTNEVAKWKAFHKWDWNYFIDHYGTFTERLNSALPEKECRDFTLAEYIQLIQRNEGVHGYYFKSQFHVDTPLLRDYSSPELFSCSYGSIDPKKRRYTLSWIYLTGANTYSELHQDIWYTSAWNALISGEKLWLFYPPDALKKEIDTDLVQPGEFDQYFAGEPVLCLQNPGDLVFTPSRWWHFVYNLKPGISLTENFVNQTNKDNVLSYFENRGLIKNHAMMRKIVSGEIK